MEGFTDEEPFVSAIYKLSGNASASELFSSDEDARPAFKGQKGKREREQMSPKKGKKKIKEDKGTKVSEDKEGSNKLNEFKKMYEKIMTEAKILSDLIRQHGNYTKMEIKDHVKEMRRWAEKGEMTLIEVEQERHTRREEKPRKEVKTCTVGTQTYLSGNEEEEEKESKEISEQVDRVVEYQDLEPLMNRHWPQATYKAIKEVEKTQDTYKDNTFVYLFDHRRDRSDGEGLELETVFPGFKEMIKTSKGDTEEMGNTQTITSRAGAKTTVKKVYMQPVTGDSVVCEETYKKLEGVLKGCKRNCNEGTSMGSIGISEEEEETFKGQRGKREREEQSPNQRGKKSKEDEILKGVTVMSEFKELYSRIMKESIILCNLMEKHGNYTKNEIKDKAKEIRRWTTKGDQKLKELDNLQIVQCAGEEQRKRDGKEKAVQTAKDIGKRKGALARTPPEQARKNVVKEEKFYTPKSGFSESGSISSERWEDEEIGASEIYDLTMEEDSTPNKMGGRQTAKKRRRDDDSTPSTPKEEAKIIRSIREEELRIHAVMEKESVSDELPTPGTMEGFTDEEPFVSAIYKLSGNASASELFSSDEDARPAFKGQKGKREREQMSPKKGKKKIKEDKGTKVSEDKEGSNKLNEFKKMYEKIMTEAKILSDLIRQHGNYTKMEIKDHVKEMRRWAEKGEMTLIEVEQERHTRREEKPRKEVKTCTVGTQTYLSGNEEEEEKESKEISEQVDRVVEYQDLEPLMNRHWPQATYKAIKEVEKTQDTYKDNTFVYLFDHRRDRSDGEGLELETVFPGFKEMIKTSKGDTEEMGNTQTITSRAGAKTTVKKVYMQPVTGDSVVCEETYKKLEGVLKGCKRNCNERGQQTIKD
ncbi:unnamed protein product [Phyllotreta striolata]|uniref:Uncharacterized protein n=1 Tax=Phyllotreta striolata TaxID=444603 RepID=A0A9P0GS33_PHYSR|nr:unnamed protein product [Phyllotreta striolata]